MNAPSYREQGAQPAVAFYGDGAPRPGQAGGGMRQGGQGNPYGVDFTYDPDRRKATTGRVTKPAGRLMQFEGLRGLSNQMSVRLRYLAYFLVILSVSGAVHIMLGASRWHTAGMWMILSSALMVATATLGTMFYTNQRNEIVEQLRHFVFGLSLFPGFGLAGLLWAAAGFFGSAGAQNDPFTFMLGGALPILYFITVLIPPLVFIKTIAGLRNIHRSNLDNEEYMRLYTRQDELAR